MKPFDLEKALVGEPVMLRDRTKAYVKYVIDDNELKFLSSTDKVHGYYVETDGNVGGFLSWDTDGVYRYLGNSPTESNEDIIGMWEEPRPTVTLTLPCPLKEPQDNMWLISNGFQVKKSSYDSKYEMLRADKECFQLGRYFATEADAQAWLDAMRNSRR